MKKLARKEYWDQVYKKMPIKREGKLSLFKDWLKNLTRDYSNFLMWDVVVPKYLPQNQDFKIIEIGCAPGKYLINFNKRFRYEPFGVEYSEKGVQITKDNFEKTGLNKDNIIQADFFDEHFASKYKEQFDLVFSRGFIEHYDDVKSVVSKHLNLIKSGGYVIISIPNLSGVNKVLAKSFNIDSYNLHNVSIMNPEKFNRLFPNDQVEKLYSGHVGLFSFGLFNTNKRWKYILYRILLLVQRPFDMVLRVLCPFNILTSQYTSPYLLFIGYKK